MSRYILERLDEGDLLGEQQLGLQLGVDQVEGVHHRLVVHLARDVQLDLLLRGLLGQEVFQNGYGGDIVRFEHAAAFRVLAEQERVQEGGDEGDGGGAAGRHLLAHLGQAEGDPGVDLGHGELPPEGEHVVGPVRGVARVGAHVQAQRADTVGLHLE